jgi:hypothetical protein
MAFSTLTGINNLGEIVGSAVFGGHRDGFRFANAEFTAFKFPDAQITLPTAVSDSGVIVGSYTREPAQGCFTFVNSTFHILTMPGVKVMECNGINASGLIVGSWSSPSEGHGLLITP